MLDYKREEGFPQMWTTEADNIDLAADKEDSLFAEVRKLSNSEEPSCSEGCQAKFKAVYAVMEQQAGVLIELQRSMK